MSKIHDRTPVSLLELVAQKVDLRALLNGIEFQESDLVDAAMKQPGLMKEAGRLRTQALYKRARYEAKLDVLRGELSQKYRNIRGPDGKREYTEPGVKAVIETRQVVIKLRKKIDRCFAEEELAKTLVEVYRMRKEAIQVIVQMGKISVQLKELAMIRNSAKLRKALFALRGRWQKEEE